MASLYAGSENKCKKMLLIHITTNMALALYATPALCFMGAEPQKQAWYIAVCYLKASRVELLVMYTKMFTIFIMSSSMLHKHTQALYTSNHWHIYTVALEPKCKNVQ